MITKVKNGDKVVYSMPKKFPKGTIEISIKDGSISIEVSKYGSFAIFPHEHDKIIVNCSFL